MKRRLFLCLPLIGGVFSFLGCGKKEDDWQVIESVQEHLFPSNGRYPGAKAFEAARYLKIVSKDKSFDQEDLNFIFRGAGQLRENGYQTNFSYEKKEVLLQAFKATQFGENWISIMISYTLEALFADPIYGGNKKEIGWKAYRHHPGMPRPMRRFGMRDV